MNKEAKDFFKVECYSASISNLLEGDFRLNAEFYLHDNKYIIPKGFETKKLSELANIFGFGPFKRHYIDNINFGVPLVSSSEMMELNPSNEGIISKELVRDYKKYLVKKNTILVSCSGTIGNVTLVDSRLLNKAISQHALRVIPNNDQDVGLIYTFLNSEFGQSIVKGKKSGAVIDEIYEGDLNAIEIAIPEVTIASKLNNLILKAFENRDLANEKLQTAQNFTLEYNGLSELSGKEIYEFENANTSRIRMASVTEFTHDFRFDAHYYSNVFKNAKEEILLKSKKLSPLSDITVRIFMGNRFTRNLVDSKNGVPFIGTKNTLQIRPKEYKFLSSSETTNLKELLLEHNWILLARSGSLGGTFGRVSFVWKNFEKFAGSEHIIRVCANVEKVDPGYLYSYLNCPYGYLGITQLRHGALIDEIDPEDLGQIMIPLPSDKQQKEIGDLVRQAYDLRAEAIRLEDEAQLILTQALTK